MREIKGPNMEKYQAVLDTCKEEEKAYQAMREKLLKTHYGKWVVIAGGEVVASGDDFLVVMHSPAKQERKYAYFTRVGYEDKVEFKIRKTTFQYDAAYAPFPIPKANARFHNATGTASKEISDLVLDTGADVTCLREKDCGELRLDESRVTAYNVRTYGGTSKPAIFYEGLVEIDNHKIPAFIQMVDETEERILGRDVLNQLRVTFDGPNKKTTIE
jgi:predicted aspartyl protease